VRADGPLFAGQLGHAEVGAGDTRRPCAYVPGRCVRGRSAASSASRPASAHGLRKSGQIAVGAAKTDTFLAARYRRLVKRMPKAKARVALARSILTIIFHLLADPTARFEELGADFYTRRLDHRARAKS
jgi:transposase